MPDTGHFYVLAIDYATDEAGRIDHVNAITIRCNRCQQVSHADADMNRMTGGTVLTCGKCGAHQAVSNARLIECDHILAAEGAKRPPLRR